MSHSMYSYLPCISQEGGGGGGVVDKISEGHRSSNLQGTEINRQEKI